MRGFEKCNYLPHVPIKTDLRNNEKENFSELATYVLNSIRSLSLFLGKYFENFDAASCLVSQDGAQPQKQPGKLSTAFMHTVDVRF